MPIASTKSRKTRLTAIPGGKILDEGGDSVETGGKYEILFDQASDAILTVLPDGRIDAANQAIEEMTGYLKSELVGANVDLMIPEAKKMGGHRARPLSRELLKSPGTYEDIAIQKKDGYFRFVDLSVRIVAGSTSHQKLALGLFRDVTEKKAMERELITKHAELKNAYFQLEEEECRTPSHAGNTRAIG